MLQFLTRLPDHPFTFSACAALTIIALLNSRCRSQLLTAQELYQHRASLGVLARTCPRHQLGYLPPLQRLLPLQGLRRHLGLEARSQEHDVLWISPIADSISLPHHTRTMTFCPFLLHPPISREISSPPIRAIYHTGQPDRRFTAATDLFSTRVKASEAHSTQADAYHSHKIVNRSLRMHATQKITESAGHQAKTVARLLALFSNQRQKPNRHGCYGNRLFTRIRQVQSVRNSTKLGYSLPLRKMNNLRSKRRPRTSPQSSKI